MSSPLKSSQNFDDNREIDRYLRCMTLKCAQFLVNSRCPKPKNTRKSFTRSASEHWFNLSIAENSTLLEEVKHIFDGRQLELSQPFCIKIYLRTNENETMLVEQWWFKKSILSPPSTNSSKSVLYNNLSTLLKSLVVMTTSLPGNSLSRRQTPSSYLLHYSLKIGEPNIDLNDNFKQHSLGRVSYLNIQFSLHVAWKTRVQFAPRKLSTITSNLSENHFEKTSNQKVISQPVPLQLKQDPLASPALTKAAFRLTPPNDDSDDDIPFGMLLKLAKTSSSPRTPSFSQNRNRHLSDMDNGIILEASDQEDDDNSSNSSETSKNIKNSEPKNQDICDFNSFDNKNFLGCDPFQATFATHFNDIKQLSVLCEEIPELEMFKEDDEDEGIESLVQQFLKYDAVKEEVFEFVKMIEELEDDNFYSI